MSDRTEVESVVASAQEKIADAAGVKAQHVRINVEHPIFGTQELTHEPESAKAAEPEPEPEPEPETPESPEKTAEQQESLERIQQAKAGESEPESEPESANAADLRTCEDCGKEGLKGQQGLAAHSRFCDAGEASEPANEPEPESANEHEGAWADLTESEQAKLRESEDTEAVNELCETADDHIHAKGRCAGKRANGERCEYGRKGFDTVFCIRHANSADAEVHPDALGE